MEMEESRSESPFSKSKNILQNDKMTKGHLSDSPEIGCAIIEQIKGKKKSLRNKSKSQANGKENDEVTNNGKDFFEEEKPRQNEIDKNFDSDSTDRENGIENGNSSENSEDNEKASIQKETDNLENDTLISVCEIPEEKIINETKNMSPENNTAEEFENTENITEECCKLETTETETNEKKNNSQSFNVIPQCEDPPEDFTEVCNENENDISKKDIDTTVKELETGEICSEDKEYSQTSNNGSDISSHYEEADETNDHNQQAPVTTTKDDLSVSIKITSFLEKWGYSEEQKQELEVSSSKKVESGIPSKFDLRKVSGRRGIKDKLNSSAIAFSSKEMEAKTPESSQICLDDSFRVRTNPPRLNSSHFNENPTLRKFKGKRCLNSEDEPEEEDDVYFNTMKKRKLDEKTQDSGLLKSFLLSPFRKKSCEDKNQLKLATAESKLSRLLSPFWFWKKTDTEQDDK